VVSTICLRVDMVNNVNFGHIAVNDFLRGEAGPTGGGESQGSLPAGSA
jgi:hypothetical protein